MIASAIAVLFTLFLTTEGAAKESGIASRYAGDAGIAADSSVVFVESFEDIATTEELDRNWEAISGREIMSISSETPPGSSGVQSLLWKHIGGESTGGSLYRRFLPGYEHLFVRFYVRFAEDIAPVHHFTFLGGFNPSTPYAQGTAGRMPDGTDFLSTAAEPGEDTWHTYTYWPDMPGAPPKGIGYGANFLSKNAPAFEKGRWVCIELMIRLNTIGQQDGEMAIWIDGVQATHAAPGKPRGLWRFSGFHEGEGGEGVRWNKELGGAERFNSLEGGDPFPGFRWRTTEDLKVNYLWLLAYISTAPDGHISNIWFDDIVVATQYVGPIH